ncbi:hypothetical protein [Micromonospora sp. NPDC048839]|uniref:hypothetical protein n=1 Tax=Micromonospora sp. NPDC048839 TaxID=3155641 RepID=UPI0033C3A5E6
MTPTLALEQLMLHPLYGDLIGQIRAVTPTAHLDQDDAAAGHATQIMTAAAGPTLGTTDTHRLDPGDAPGWLRLGLLDTWIRWTTGTADTCRHQPTHDRPQPVIAAAWKPGLVVCPDCAMLTAAPRTADTTCDACGHQCGDLASGGGIYAGMVQLGPLIYQYGTCADCRPAITEQSSPPSATHTPEPATPRGTGRGRAGRPHNRRRRPR